jgi:hypothetical protein
MKELENDKIAYLPSNAATYREIAVRNTRRLECITSSMASTRFQYSNNIEFYDECTF